MPTSIELNAAMMADSFTLGQLEEQLASYDKYTPAEEVAIIDAAIAQKKDGRGGKREGAGRPAGAKNKKAASSYVLQIRLDGDTEQALKSRAEAEGTTISKLVRGLIDRYLSTPIA